MRVLELGWNKERVEYEILQYRILANDGIITEEEFSVKEEELLFYLKQK